MKPSLNFARIPQQALIRLQVLRYRSREALPEPHRSVWLQVVFQSLRCKDEIDTDVHV
jgi:hypothetical protein